MAKTGPDASLKEKVEPLNKPVMLSHGTITCKNLEASRRFYEEIFQGTPVWALTLKS